MRPSKTSAIPLRQAASPTIGWHPAKLDCRLKAIHETTELLPFGVEKDGEHDTQNFFGHGNAREFRALVKAQF